MKTKQGGGKGPKRNRKAVNLTLSDEVQKGGRNLAEKRGLKFTQLVEKLVRDELRRVGILPPENQD